MKNGNAGSLGIGGVADHTETCRLSRGLMCYLYIRSLLVKGYEHSAEKMGSWRPAFQDDSEVTRIDWLAYL